MKEKIIKILLVEDSTIQRLIIQKLLNELSSRKTEVVFEIIQAKQLSQAIQCIDNCCPDVILLALTLSDSIGIDTVVKVHNHAPDIPIVVLTGTEDTEIGMRSITEGAQDYLVKNNVDSDSLNRSILYALERGRLLEELKNHKERIEKIALKLSKYLPPEVYASIFAGLQDVKIGATAKRLTILFSDIVNFTSTVEGMEEGSISPWLNSYLNDMSKITHKYGGTLDKFIGDAIMIFFGDPNTFGRETDAVKCVLMALEMLDHCKKINMKIRIGIHSGECIVGNFGSDYRMDYTIIGKAVNLASRMESNSDTARILITEQTMDLVKDYILCEPRGNIKVKGIDREIMTYWAIKAKETCCRNKFLNLDVFPG